VLEKKLSLKKNENIPQNTIRFKEKELMTEFFKAGRSFCEIVKNEKK